MDRKVQLIALLYTYAPEGDPMTFEEIRFQMREEFGSPIGEKSLRRMLRQLKNEQLISAYRVDGSVTSPMVYEFVTSLDYVRKRGYDIPCTLNEVRDFLANLGRISNNPAVAALDKLTSSTHGIFL